MNPDLLAALQKRLAGTFAPQSTQTPATAPAPQRLDPTNTQFWGKEMGLPSAVANPLDAYRNNQNYQEAGAAQVARSGGDARHFPLGSAGVLADVTGPEGEGAFADKIRRVLTAPEKSTGINAWHASPYTFDKFSLDHAGSGTGGAAFGHGAYFGAPAVSGPAGEYDKLFTLNKMDENGWLEGGYGGNLSAVGDALAALRKTGGNADAAAQAIQRSGFRPNGGVERMAERVNSSKPRLYNVNLDTDPNKLLSWGQSLTDQPKAIQRAIKETGTFTGSGGAPFVPNRYHAGMDLYEHLENQLGDAKGASEWLNKQGIDGVRFGGQDPDSPLAKWSMFNPETKVRILKMLGAGGVASQLPQDPDQ